MRVCTALFLAERTPVVLSPLSETMCRVFVVPDGVHWASFGLVRVRPAVWLGAGRQYQ